MRFRNKTTSALESWLVCIAPAVHSQCPKMLAILTFLFTSGIRATDVGNDTTQLAQFCRRFEHRTAVLNNKLYIDGGYINVGPDIESSPTNYTNSLLTYADLLTSDDYMPIVRTGSPKPATVPSLAGGTLWADEINGRFYAFGGYFPEHTPSPFETWTHDELTGSWTKVRTEGNQMAYVAHGMSAVSSDSGIAYYLGGYHDGGTDAGWGTARLYTASLVAFDMVERKYENLTGPDDRGRGEGLMVFVPASTEGLLIYFGGVIQDRSGKTLAGRQQIWIYDISLRRWYVQNATGMIPDARKRFCGVAAWPDDQSSFNIYLYGGLRPNELNINGTVAFDDVYTLSVPAFHWVKMFPDNAQPSTGSNGHHSLTCNIINGTQMLVMGGTFPNSAACDVPAEYGQHNADLGQVNDDRVLWRVFNQDNPPYRVPGALTKVIGGTAKGGANVTAPFGNRTYDKFLFEKKYAVPQRYPTPLGTASSLASPQVSDKSRSAPRRATLVGAIVGSIVGGIVIGIAVFMLIYYIRRRRGRGTEVENPRAGTEGNRESGKMLDEKIPPDELMGQSRIEMGEEREFRREMWVDPVELPGLGIESQAQETELDERKHAEPGRREGHESG
ncbi:hypothetical protein BCR34DRAFT_647580 [Clohesyomyces aquaticus]|uniref:Kelch repeat protein-like protein n=1 Tax=Clohesyomyces aquaticus TaxID=1231657 RepID=A0A1Y1Y451_9PLEO|nr:hypothetical protein BCR34DRAFT_647580 [Clohesyomyces aquaticus]